MVEVAVSRAVSCEREGEGQRRVCADCVCERVSDLRSANEVMVCCTVEVRDVRLGMRQEIILSRITSCPCVIR